MKNSTFTIYFLILAVLAIVIGNSVLIAQKGAKKTIRNLQPSWAADGHKIAFVTNRDGKPEIYLMYKNGSHQKNLTNNAALDMGVSWSHNGDKLAFVSNRDSGKDIYIMNTQNGELRKLTNRGDLLMSPPAWSPDDTKLVFASGTHRDADLHTVDIKSETLQRLTKNPTIDAAPASLAGLFVKFLCDVPSDFIT